MRDFDRVAAMDLLAEMNNLNDEGIASRIGSDRAGKAITAEHVKTWREDPSFPPDKEFIERLTTVKQVIDLLQWSDDKLARLAKLSIEYVKPWLNGSLPPPPGLIIKMLHQYQEGLSNGS